MFWGGTLLWSIVAGGSKVYGVESKILNDTGRK